MITDLYKKSLEFVAKPPRQQLFRLTLLLGIALLILIALFLVSLTWTFISDSRLHTWPCLSSRCISTFESAIEGPVSLLKFGAVVLTTLATVGGVLIALLNYINRSESSALSNHIAHLTVFNDYVSAEIARRSRLSIQSFDLLEWYNSVFDNSRNGSTSISVYYLRFTNRINNEIERASEEFRDSKKSQSFDYKFHQSEMRRLLREIGIQVGEYPRADFYEIETQILMLLRTVNRTFAPNSEGLAIFRRSYENE